MFVSYFSSECLFLYNTVAVLQLSVLCQVLLRPERGERSSVYLLAPQCLCASQCVSDLVKEGAFDMPVDWFCFMVLRARK